MLSQRTTQKNLKKRRMASPYIIFSLLFFVMRCRHANGARDVFKHGATQSMEKVEESSNVPYIMSYQTKEGAKEVQTPYVMAYEAKQSPYVMGYGIKEGAEEVETPYVMSYEKNESPNYITNYGTKEAHELKEVETPYVMGYGTKEGRKEVETPYVMSYEKDESPNYIPNYGTKEAHELKEVETPYVMGYGTKEGGKEVENPYVMSYEKNQRPNYITNYGTKEAHESKEVEARYITGYISARDTKEPKQVEAPYITGYISPLGTKEPKEVEAPYMTGYISAESAKEKVGTKCKHHKHVNPPSLDTKRSQESTSKGHEHHHIHAHSSSLMDHNEASKQGFFTFDDLHKGMIMPLNFPNQEHSPFLPKDVADSIPFSTPQLPQLLQLFSIPQGSRDANNMAYALEQCEMKPINGETKFCATSLESMTDFVTKIIGAGARFNILSTTHPITSTSITQNYILEESKEVLASKMVFCHPVAYPYAVFFCHHFEKDTKFFKVPLRGENGDKAEAMAVCHMDTSDWDPNHSIFGLLGIKAGASSPVCHFFPKNHLVWIPSPTTDTV